MQEYLSNAIDLKNYGLKHFAPATTPGAQKMHCLALGNALGQWLRAFHEWAASPDQLSLRHDAVTNEALQKIKHATYYEYLVQLVGMFPALLSGSKGVFEQVKTMAEAEMSDDAPLRVVHGDFWTGK